MRGFRNRWVTEAARAYNGAMDILLTILSAVVVLGFLVFIHEGGHFVAARAFGVRVTEFMIGLPGPNIGVKRGETTFGVTAIPLGGYARVCGMEPGEMSPYLQAAMTSVYARGTALMEDVARDCGISDDEAYEALEELVEWGTITGPKKTDEFNMYRTPGFKPTRRMRHAAVAEGTVAPVLVEGEARPLSNSKEAFREEYRQQYRSLPFWKRAVILAAGPLVNLLFAIIAFVLIYSVIGFDYQNTATGEISHITVSPLRAIQAGFMYIGMVVQAVAGLFNPQTAAETVSQSTSVVGIAVMSKNAFEAGLADALFFTSMLSVSLGIMNLLPIPPLDGGKLIIEIYQRIRRKVVSMRVVNFVSYAGVALFMLFFIIMMNQDIQRFVFGNWS